MSHKSVTLVTILTTFLKITFELITINKRNFVPTIMTPEARY